MHEKLDLRVHFCLLLGEKCRVKPVTSLQDTKLIASIYLLSRSLDGPWWFSRSKPMTSFSGNQASAMSSLLASWKVGTSEIPLFH